MQNAVLGPVKLNAKVLVVDDDTDTRLAIAGVLRDEGYDVDTLEDGARAFDYLARETTPACLVLDLWMPERDGWTLAADVLEGRLPAVPIVVVTAAASHFSYPVPARYVLRKPFSPTRLSSMVRELTGL